ncbi:uncharacterized protein LOC124297805 [Neodiprion virginianus]|uniref:uncharacterized protein LOC124297805 n=1 Tax=Neodiprion virginianus TaxID=2961670 RepID=UPI001EE6D0E1|nr:uncharacterized protein LOC124297805 [Neodiprion virginianus]
MLKLGQATSLLCQWEGKAVLAPGTRVDLLEAPGAPSSRLQILSGARATPYAAKLMTGALRIRESREKGDSDGWRTKLSLRTYEVVRRPGRARDEFRCRLPKHAPPPIRTANGAPSVPHAARNQLQCVPVSLRRSRFPSLTTIDSSIRKLVQAPLPWTTLADLQREEPLPRIGFLQQVNAGPEGMNDSAERHRR